MNRLECANTSTGLVKCEPITDHDQQCQRECGGSIHTSHLERYDRNEPAERCSEALALEKIAPRYPGDPSPEKILGKPGERMLTNGRVTPSHVLPQAQLIILGASTGIGFTGGFFRPRRGSGTN